MKISTKYTGLEVAVIGMAGRFPGAEDLNVFWKNIVNEIESISYLSDEELMASGVDPNLLSNPNYVKAKGIFPDLEYFDADFFNYTPGDASILDPQVRALHEEVYHALENAGYASEQYRGSIGLFIGASNNLAWETQTLKEVEERGGYGFAALQLNDKDFAATRIAYSLNLKGPSVTVHSACSTSLYAVDLACRNILTGACSLAVAGGSGLTLPRHKGYLYQEGMINSPDGHCRPFDVDAKGTIEGNGLGIAVLKRLDAAIRDRDHIYAVIRGTAVNNDGKRKVGFTAPSVEGQAEVIRRALAMADVPAESIAYIETHGTGTQLGDPVEIAGLNKVFHTAAPSSCGIGSLKGNIGHLDTAAGISSFIKTALALKNKIIPASINFKEANPSINLEDSPFRVISKTEGWNRQRVSPEQELYYPLRAGISAFGIGGTNVHVVLEEAPERESSEAGRPWKLLCLSAHTEAALARLKRQYLENLTNTAENIEPSDLAFSLQTGRRNLGKRYTMVYKDIKDLTEGLAAHLEDRQLLGRKAAPAPIDNPSVYFLLPGQGAQYPGMAKELYWAEPDFKTELDNCLKLAEDQGMEGLRQLLLEPKESDTEKIKETDIAQVLLLIVEYALARLLMSWGVQPEGLIGHSLGEYTAACLAGVFTIEEGIRLVMARGRLMKSMPKGAMLAVNGSAEIIQHLLSGGLSMAAINSPNQCTVAGPNEEINSFKAQLAAMGLTSKKLPTDHAFHSPMMEGALEPLREICSTIDMKAPEIPYISNVTGAWIKADDAKDPIYYAKHMINYVNFAKGIEKILEDEKAVLIEVGPGCTLTTFAGLIAGDKSVGMVNILRHPQEDVSDDFYLTEKLGELWKTGVAINWKTYYRHQMRNRIPLPAYPFEKKHFPVDVSHFNEIFTGNGGKKPTEAIPKEKDHGEKKLEVSSTEEFYQSVSAAKDMASGVQELEVTIAGLWSKILGHDHIDVDEDFFKMGGDSFKVIQFTSELEREGYRVVMNEVFKYPTARSLAHYISSIYLKDTIPEEESLQLEKLLLNSLGIVSELYSLEGTATVKILFVEETAENSIDKIRIHLRSLNLPGERLPNYIFPMSMKDKLSDSFDLKELVEAGVLSNSEEVVINHAEKQIAKERRKFNEAILSQPVTRIYGISKVQQIHFSGEVRLQLYLIEFFEMVDEELLEQAFTDVVASHGLLRSCLIRQLGRYKWKEFAPPSNTPIPRIDLSHLTPEAQNRAMDAIAKLEWKADFKRSDTPMYHVILVKLNEQRYDLFFQYDHSIFDVSSGQVVRRHILQRYRNLKNGVKTPMPESYSYQEFIEQIYKGPVNINADELISKFDLKKYNEDIRMIKEKLKELPSGRVQMVRREIDLTPFNIEGQDNNEIFEIALQVHVLVIARLLELEAVPFDLLFQNRRYQGKGFSDVVGLVLDSIPLLVPVDRDNPHRMTAVIREKIELINKHNINFLNLIWNIPTWWRWRKIRAIFKDNYASTFYSPILLNYAGNAEQEYEKVWNYSMQQLDDEDQKKLNYADYYGLAKMANNRLDFLILCKFEPDMERIQKIFDEEINYLLSKYTEESRG